MDHLRAKCSIFDIFKILGCQKCLWSRAPDKIYKLTCINNPCVISSPNPMFDHMFESSRWDDSNKWANIGFDEELGIIEIKTYTLSGALCVG